MSDFLEEFESGHLVDNDTARDAAYSSLSELFYRQTERQSKHGHVGTVKVSAQ